MADAFQPKFVDLVRNYSTTVGTGNFVLGPAVNGYAGLASALTAGDRFYYSAIGVDKPAEREVGRGTLLADGSVAREPITGSKTNFTSGTKAIALIAAAEWFARVQSGGGAGVLPADTRLTLAALSDRQSPAILAEAGREGIFLFDRSNLAAKVSADPNQGMFVAPASDASGASGAWVRKFSGKAQASWFGFAVTATAAANLSAINAALATLKAAAPANVYSYPGSIGLEIGEGQFDVGGAIAITHPLELCGQLSGPFGGGGTVLRFTANTAGINTSASAQGACIHGFNLVGAFAGTNSSTAHGLDLSVKIDAYNLRIEDFSGDGIHGYANGAGANLNNSSFRTIAIFNCRNGSWMEGGDGNASTFDNVSCFSNRQCGHRDKSFIGNVYRGGDVSGNGNHPAFATRCIQAGNCYAVALDQEVWCSTNPPSGTTAHNQGWVYLGSAGIRAPATAWTTGLSWYASAPLCGGNAGGNSASLFDGVYVESDQNPCIMQSPATVRDLMPPQPGFVLYPGGASYDGYEYTHQNARKLQGSLTVGAFLRVGASGYFANGMVFGANPEAPTSSLSEAGGNFYAQMPSGGQLIFRNAATFAQWATLDAANGFDIRAGGLKINGTPVIDSNRNGSFAAVSASGNVAATGTVSGSNLSGTHSGTSSGVNTGDQDLSNYATTTALGLKANSASPTFSGTLTTANSIAGGAGLNIGSGVAPTAPNSGDVWINASSGVLTYRSPFGSTQVVDTIGISATYSATKTFAAGSATVAPFKFQAGVLLTTVAAHSAEWDGTNLYLTTGAAARRTVAYTDSAMSPASVAASGAVTSSAATAGIGYATGSGGAVTQLTSRTTGVTLNKASGAITLVSATTTAGQVSSFTVTSSAVAATDTVNLSVKSGSGVYLAFVTAVGAGSFSISVHTPAAVAVAEAPVINFAVVKAVAA